MRFADGHVTFIANTPEIPIADATPIPPTSIRGWKSQLILSNIKSSPIFNIWNGEYWEIMTCVLQITIPTDPIIFNGLLTTNTNGAFVFYISSAIGLSNDTSIMSWLKSNYTYNKYINPFIIRQIPSVGG